MKVMILIQGLYYFLSGLWPLISIQSFMLITGPKQDIWLVKTVGVLITSSGLVLLYNALINPEISMEVLLLACCNALMLSAIDIHYVKAGTIRRVYLADALIEIIFAGFYLWQFL